MAAAAAAHRHSEMPSASWHMCMWSVPARRMHTHTHTHARTQHTHTHTRARARARTHALMQACSNTRTQTRHLKMHACTHACEHTQADKHADTRACPPDECKPAPCTRARTPAHMQACTRTHTCTRTHARTRTHTRTHACTHAARSHRDRRMVECYGLEEVKGLVSEPL